MCRVSGCYHKQTQRTTKARVTSNVKGREQAIRGKATQPGDEISCDQFVCSVPGRLPHTKGREGLASRYYGGTLYYDSYSKFMHVQCQVSLRTGETIMGKRKLDSYARQFGVKIKAYTLETRV